MKIKKSEISLQLKKDKKILNFLPQFYVNKHIRGINKSTLTKLTEGREY